MRVDRIFQDRKDFRKGNVGRGGAQLEFPNFRSKILPMTTFFVCWLEETGEWIVQDLTSLKIYLMDTRSETPEEAVKLMVGWKWAKKQVEDVFPEFSEIASKTPPVKPK